MTLQITFFDVGHGDCIVVEARESDGSHWLVVDSSLRLQDGEHINPAAAYLRTRGVEFLSNLVVTHFHRDHVAGIEQVLGFNPDRVFVPPFVRKTDEKHTALLSRSKQEVLRILAENDDPEVVRPTKSLAHLLAFLSKNPPGDRLVEANGPANKYRLSPSVEFEIALPLPKVRGVLHARMNDEAFTLDTFAGHNEASIAVRLFYAGRVVLLAGDSEASAWFDHQAQRRRDHVVRMDASLLKAAHHGSRHNNPLKVLNYQLASPDVERIAVCSANGVSHPHAEYFANLAELGVLPYCTGRSTLCDDNVVRLPTTAGQAADVATVLQNYLVPRSMPCQGDIVVTISDDGTALVEATRALPCPYRPTQQAKRISSLV